ncbi:FKBP-type peptidyl-prolyl cis-trans isomerase [Thalassotalea fonticola]|uniref:Peptidyl-prolyl cis-trans isomerase n=1 Tax=Thalassotalea fonticola TaxID=3065649 RepID=A0ABZ0GU25_9GAMM|nr:FKBP-type peptidyl-prolyl cis-trans isomerase [Colwelliaceae bacterium S1-1]
MKTIVEDSSILMHITMKLSDGSAADSTKVNNKPAKVNMGDQSLSPAFEQQLLGLNQGDSKEFTLEAKDAFGDVNPENIHYLDRQKFNSDTPAEVGSIVTFTQPGGEIPGIIREVNDLSVTVDFNHPLAGQAITFAVDVVDIL